MPQRRQILVLTDSRSSAPAEVEPMVGIQRFMLESGSAWEIHWEKHCPDALARGGRRFAGIIGRAAPRVVQLAAHNRIPMVNIWSSAAPTRVPSVVADFEAAGRLAAEYFLERGLRKAAFLGTDRRFSDRLRCGFTERLAAARVPCLTGSTAWGYEDTAARFERFTRSVHGLVARLRPPVGILGFEDTACRYLAYACEERGLRIPDDVAIMGMTNNVLACMQPSPSLSSVDCNFPLVGYKAAELLAALMAGRTPPREPVLVPPRTIVPRRSSEHVFTDDPLVGEALRFIAARRTRRLQPRDVARHVAASERTLQRRFNAAIGHSIVHEIIGQRVRHARQLLLDGDLLLKQIARECGFHDARRLGVEFKKREGMPPTEYRRRHRG